MLSTVVAESVEEKLSCRRGAPSLKSTLKEIGLVRFSGRDTDWMAETKRNSILVSIDDTNYSLVFL